jgi:hypothetical protein
VAAGPKRIPVGGEVSPFLWPRVDLAKYSTWLRQLVNWVPLRSGGSQRRPGWQHIGEASTSTKKTRVIPFIFNAKLGQTYAMEFGHLYVRFHHAVVQPSGLLLGRPVLEAQKTVSAISQSNPAVVTSTGHGYADGQEVVLEAVQPDLTGMDPLMNRHYKVIFIDANTFGLRGLDGVNANSSALDAYAGGATVTRVYTVTTTYTETEIFDLVTDQSADVVYIAHDEHPTAKLTRFADTNWTLTDVAFGPVVLPPHGGTGSIGGSGGPIRWRVTAIDKDTREESLPAREATKAITGATQANPCSITAVGHGYLTGDEVYIEGIVGMTQLNGRTFTITVTGVDAFTLDGENSTGHSAYSSGGTAARTYFQDNAGDPPTTGSVGSVTFPLVANAEKYAIYRAESGGEFAFVGYAKTSPFVDRVTVPPDTGDSPPLQRNPFVGAGNYPSVVAIVQQRLCLGGTKNKPETIWMSEAGHYHNLTAISPATKGSSFNFQAAGGRVNRVRALREAATTYLFTEGAEIELQGDEAGGLSFDSTNPRVRSTNGSGTLQPLSVGFDVLFLQAQGSLVRSAAMQAATEGQASDLTVYASHLVDGHTIVDWAYQTTPHSIVWAVRDDGVLLSLTYNLEQEIFAWARHWTLGFVESVCCIPEGQETSLYLVVRREIDGRSVRSIERMEPFGFRSVEEACLVDFAKVYDGRNHDPSLTLTLQNSASWGPNEKVEVRSSDAFFRDIHVGDQVQLTGSDGTRIRITITDYVPAIIPYVKGKPHKVIPEWMREEQIGTWALAKKTLTDLWHLEGEHVAAIGDGYVSASPYNPKVEKVLVEDGVATFDQHYAYLQVGLPYLSDLESLDVDQSNGITIADETKFLKHVVLWLMSSRTIWVGGKPPKDDDVDATQGLKPLNLRTTGESVDSGPPKLVTGVFEKNVQTEFNSHGRIFLRVVDPVPATVLAFAPKGLFPFRG